MNKLELKTSQILKRAKVYLWDGTIPLQEWQRTMVCLAIGAVANRECWGIVTRKRGFALAERIDKSLGLYTSVIQWLNDEKGICLSEPTDKQAYRHAWVDHMIEEYKAIGD